MMFIPGVIASSLQMLSKSIRLNLDLDFITNFYSLCSFSTMDIEIPDGWGYFAIVTDTDATISTYSLCSFSTSEKDIPAGWGYFTLNSDTDATVSTYSLCSFSVPEPELPSNLAGYYFLSTTDVTSSTYSLCSYSVPLSNLTTVMPLSDSTISLFRTSIYGLSSDAVSILGAPQTKFSFFTWEVSSANSSGYVFDSINSNVRYTSGGSNPDFDASLQPIIVRGYVGYNNVIYRTKEIYVKPYETFLDIPNLQLWLDASEDGANVSTYKWFFDDAWSFNGSSTYITSPDSTSWEFLSRIFTVECWVNFRAVGSQQCIVTNYQSSSTGWWLQLLNTNVIAAGFSGDGNDIIGTTTIQANTWYHVAVAGSSGSYKLFVNGVQEGSTFTGATSFAGTTLNIGRISTTAYLNGYISNLRIVNGSNLYPNNFVVSSTHLSNVPGTELLTLQDSTIINNGNPANTLTTFGSPTLVPLTNQVLVSAWSNKSPTANLANTPLRNIVRQPYRNYTTFGNELGVLQFNGTSNFLSLSTPINVSNDFTHFAVYERSGTVNSITLGNAIASDSTSPYMHYNDNFMYSGNTRTNLAQPTYPGYHIAGVRKNQYLFVDGFIISPFATSWGGTKTATVNSVGLYSNTQYHNGALGEIIQTSAMLPDNEVQFVFQELFKKWNQFTLPPRLINDPVVFGSSLSSLSSTYGTWGRQTTGYQVEWQQSSDGNTFTTIPLITSTLYYPTTADYGSFFRTSVSAINANGVSVDLSNTVQLTTVNTVPVSIVRTTIFTVSAISGTWVSTLPITLLYQWQVSADNSGWQNFGTLTTSNTVFLSAYSLSTVNVRALEYGYNLTLEI